jgi:ketose-bisphosphate aldolase
MPSFNIPYLPMMEPVVRALRDTDTVGLVSVARLEWVKFEAGGLAAIREEYERVKDERFTRLHLDHVPVIDEDDLRVDFLAVMREAISLGYESIMLDGSRLPFGENVAATREVASMAHEAGIAIEAELGAVMGHEDGPMPPYEELFASGKGFTDPGEAKRFVEETGVDWLSVAVGSVHGAISKAKKDEKKIAARLNIEQLDRIRRAIGVPLVLHGGSGIRKECIMEGIRHGIAKINIGTAIRQPYERAAVESVEAGRDAVYSTLLGIVREDLEIEGSARTLGL